MTDQEALDIAYTVIQMDMEGRRHGHLAPLSLAFYIEDAGHRATSLTIAQVNNAIGTYLDRIQRVMADGR